MARRTNSDASTTNETAVPGDGEIKDSGKADELERKCVAMADTMVLANEQGQLFDVDLVSFKVLPHAVAACTKIGANAMAVDETGTPWVADVGGQVWRVELGSEYCKAVSTAPLKVTAMTFLYDEGEQREFLYMVADGKLDVVDPLTFARAAINQFATLSLLGTGHGELYALDDLDDANISIARVDLGAAVKKPIWTVKRPTSERFSGGMARANDLVLLFERSVYQFLPAKGELLLLGKLSEDLGFVAAVAGSNCMSGDF